jgi:hypothetical protein
MPARVYLEYIMQKIELKTAPELVKVIRAADPNYRKRQATLSASETVGLYGTYWDGGSRYTYTAVDLVTGRSKGAPQYDPPQFGGPRVDPVVAIPEGVAIVQTGIFLGKTATARVYVNPVNMAKLLPA